MIVFVTGATSGFGEATARRFLQAGCTVIGTGRRAQRLEKLRSELGDRFIPLSFDVGRRQDAERAIDSLPDDLRAIDVLVNNAGGAIGLDRAQDAQLEDWEAMIDSNVKGRCVLHASVVARDGTARTRTYHQHCIDCCRISISRRKRLWSV